MDAIDYINTDEENEEEDYEHGGNQNDELDLDYFNKNYETLKKNYKTSKYLNKYELTNILSKRAEQLSQGSISFLENAEIYDSVYEIANEELKQKKIPFIIRRPISGGFEYWKIEDLNIEI
tara:strand:+ start:399 stop:761 length:363 start_codon:yes stop_codon:yes gene_type:complete